MIRSLAYWCSIDLIFCKAVVHDDILFSQKGKREGIEITSAKNLQIGNGNVELNHLQDNHKEDYSWSHHILMVALLTHDQEK